MLFFLGTTYWVSTQPKLGARTSISMLYPDKSSQTCQTEIQLLRSGKLPIASDKGAVETVGLSPSWGPQPGRSKFFMFRLHTLDFLECLIQAGESGDAQALAQAKRVVLDWETNNEFKGSVDRWTWADNVGAWEEHSVSWRAVLLSYLYHVLEKSPQRDPQFMARLEAMAQTHASFLSRHYSYMPNHNHGLSGTGGLMALGMTFWKLPQSGEWLELALARAEQQMLDTVSPDGIQLEQSGEYQFFTLRTFIELYRAAQAMNRPLSEAYRQRLDRMLGAAAVMVGPNRRVEGLPYSEPDKDVVSSFLGNINSLSLGPNAPGLARFKRVVAQGDVTRSLAVYKRGGYSFFQAHPGRELEVVFHTRILNAPHAHQDALGLTAVLGDQPLLIYPSANLPAADPYFLGPDAHNTVQIKGLQQQQLDPAPGVSLWAGLINWGKLRGVTEKLGLADWWLGQRRQFGVDEPSLNARATDHGGKVLAFASSPELDFVTAQHQTYPGVTHRRTVARVGSRYLLVWDRLAGDQVHQYTQTFHFASQTQLGLSGSQGVARLGNQTIARFVQLHPVATGGICRGQRQPEPCGWYRDTAGRTEPTPALRYRTQGNNAEFLWVLYAGEGPLQGQVRATGETAEPSQRVTLSGEGGSYRLRLEGSTLRFE